MIKEYIAGEDIEPGESVIIKDGKAYQTSEAKARRFKASQASCIHERWDYVARKCFDCGVTEVMLHIYDSTNEPIIVEKP